MGDVPVRYRSSEEDSERWARFSPRKGDIVISTRSKSGTTWMQMICALLVFQRPEFPGPLAELSPWLDWLALPESELFDELENQQHRRFIKTHTPLDGLPLLDDVFYVVVARHPLDMAVSLYHQGANLDRRRIAELTGAAQTSGGARPDLVTWMSDWIGWSGDRSENLDSLPGVLWHLSDAWHRRHTANVTLVHYDDLVENLAGEMARLADALGFEVAAERLPRLAEAATFSAMKRRSHELIPDRRGVIKDPEQFFREGRSGSAVAALPHELISKYHERTAALASAELLAWLHRP